MSSDIRMLVKVEKSFDLDGRFFHVIGMPVKMTYEAQDAEWMPYGGFYRTEGDPHYENLQVRGQGDVAEGRVYGHEVIYRDKISVSLDEAERMVKTLRSIDRKMRKLQDDLGFTSGYVDYLARAGHAMGISQYGFLPITGQTFANGERYQWYGATMISSMVKERIKALREAAGVLVTS